MKIYCQNGIVKDVTHFKNENGDFHIQEIDNEISNRFTYPDDSINYTLDDELVLLYDTLRDIIFDDTTEYYREVRLLPVWVTEAGQNSDCSVSTEMFNQFICEYNCSDICKRLYNLYKHLYLVDCQFLVGTIQNMLNAMEYSFIEYYKAISKSHILEKNYQESTNSNKTIFIMSEYSTYVSSIIETYFTKAYSILDVVCKICYEMQFRQNDFSSYKKLKCADVLWGSRKKLTINEMPNTLFEKCDLINKIEALRNEVVHNGTWELNPKIFIKLDNGQVQERFMLFPDMSQGHLTSVKSRKHFFASGIKVNDVFPLIHSEFKSRLLKTIEIMNKS